MHNVSGPTYDVGLIQDDMAARGWLPVDLARAAGISHMTVARFLTGERRTARMAKKIAKAFGYSTARRYVVSSRDTVAAAEER